MVSLGPGSFITGERAPEFIYQEVGSASEQIWNDRCNASGYEVLTDRGLRE